MDLSRRSRLPPLIIIIVILCVHMSQARFYGDRQKRQHGANMYLPASSIIPEGEGNDPNEWTEWSSPSECSRSCGGGVSYQTRECLRTGSDGYPMCTGGNRKYFSCNTQDCPEEEPDFRVQQCSRFNSLPFDSTYYEWVPYTNAPNPCELNCMPKGERFYYRHKAKVIDGTRCNDQELNVCVDGQCQPVGCDMMLGSSAKEDNCHKCGGDGTTCRTIADRFTTSNLAAGYNDLLLIPSGATNIRIHETAPSNNYLACRNLSSHYYLNGNWRIDFPRPMLFAGSWWTYQRKPNGFAAPDKLTCRGPTTEPVYIVMLVQDKNISIDYEYSIPQSVSSSTPDVYTWTHMEYGPCSASCGGGTQTRTVTCNNRLNLEAVNASFCDDKAKPAESQECGTKPCAPHWVTGEWGKCSKGCGSDGIQNRTVSCERVAPSGEHTVEDDAVCLQEVGNKPANQQECNRDVKNCPKYHLGPWSPCDKLCGEGKQNRKVTCYIEENGRKKVLRDEDCVEEKPQTETTCMLAPCEGVDWIISQWGGCDACGQTTETRTAICGSKSGKVYPDEFCAPEVPLLSRSCESKKCKTQWFTSEWSKCSSACGKGLQSRIVLCGEFDGKTISKVTDESECDTTTKPEGSQECEGEDKECPGQWFSGPWGSCSKPCGGGERQREVLCLANGTKSSNCDEGKIESLSEKCNSQACTEDEVMPVESSGKPVSDEDEEDCEEDEDEDVELVTDKMSEDLKIADGIDLDEDTTFSSLMTDELMMSDSTPPTDTTNEGASTESPLTTVEGSGDDTESTSMASIGTEGSGDMETTSESVETDQTTGQAASTERSDVSDTTGSESTDLSTDSIGSTNASDSTDSSTDIPASTDASEATDSSTESSEPTGASESTDATDASSSTDASAATDASVSTDVSTDSSVSTDASSSTDGSTDTTESPELSSAVTDVFISTDLTGLTDSSGSTETAGSTESPETTDVSESTEETSSATDSSTDTTAVSASSSDTSPESSTPTDFTTESSESTDSSTDDTTESTATTDVSTDSSVSTDASVSTDSTTDASGSTDASASTDVTGTTDATGPTDASSSTDGSVTPTDVSDTTDATSTNDVSASTDVTGETDASTTIDYSASTDSSGTTDPSVSTDASASTVSSASTDYTDITAESGFTDGSTESTDSSQSTESTISSSDASTVTAFDISTETATGGSTDTESSTGVSGISVTTESGSSDTTGVTEGGDTTGVTEGGDTTGVSSQTPSDETTDVSRSDATTESVSADTTLESGTDTTVSDDSSTSSDLFDSTTESSGDTSLSTDEFTTVDIWTTDDEYLENSTPNTLESVITKESKPRKCKGKKPKDCKKTEHGCCPDGKHAAKGPFDEGCPIPKTCVETEFGCCHDGVSPADGKNFEGCPKSQCAETLFGCCSDKFTPAEGEDDEGCPEPTTEPPTTTTELPEEETTMENESSEIPETTEAPVPPGAVASCSFNEFGCCPDGTTAATGENFAGCNVPAVSTDCRSSEFGCCYDGRTPATGPDNQGCASCTFEPYGCCPDKETPAHGPLGEGCCLSAPYGCCPDNINSARGPNFEDCDCQYAPYGCCPDQKTAARGPNNDGCGCENSQFGCCPDKITPAQGPKFEGCACHTLQFGCCPDGVTVAQGPHHYGCHCSHSEHKCCPDDKTAAKGPNFEGCTCLESKYGCCPDGITSATDDKFGGCENVKEPPQKSCGLQKETGPCGNFSIKYFFDTSYGACAKFWYGGCEGNGNRFETESDCKETCQDYTGKDACFLPKSSGPCTGHISKWYFDSDRGRCEEFKYGGCFGTNNRFDSKEACQSLCSISETTPPCDQPMDKGPCEGSFERWFYDNETDVCRPFTYGGCKGNNNNYATESSCNYQCRQPGVHKDYCSLPKQTGDCSEKHARWHYSEADKKCMPFYYTGCGGNKNSFPSLESCEDHCPKEVEKSVCEIAAEVGECTNYEPMWYFDTKDKLCRQFYYGGCGGNGNKFATEESCLQRCETVPEPEPAPQPQPQQRPEQPVASINVCDQTREQGPCANYTLLWAYDKERGMCSQFYYGGCEGNGNRFNSEEECAHQCIRAEQPKTQDRPEAVPRPVEPEVPDDDNVCLLAQDMGGCDQYSIMWYFDAHEVRCTMFYYGGCGGNGNRFSSKEECNNRCLSDNAPGDIGSRIGDHDEEASTEVDASPEADDNNKCFLPAAPGNCLDNERRWYYNSADGVCDQFVFTGCEGNANNYATETQCEDECFPVHETCKLPALRGNCNETMIRWHYSESEGKCNEFEFTGCRGNRNNFVTEQECMSRCGGEPPAPTYSVCDLSFEAGECDNSTTAWHYDSEKAMCVAVTYTGCGGNGNRFQSKEQCERQCGEFKGVDVCNEDVSAGPCRQWETRFYFNKNKRTCEPFSFGGCEGTGNRFENRAECESLCIIGQEPTYSDNRDICKQQVDIGRCNGYSITERRWYYDDARGNCVTFIYSGCAGNQNNFRSYESCFNYCSKPEITNNEVLPTNRCEEFENECRSLSCPYKIQRIPVDGDCQRCECSNPCADYSCPEGEQCAIEVSTERSVEFMPVCRPTTKPGICPQLSASDGPCDRECYTDADCREDNKCCSNGCGSVCVHPSAPTIPTTAPTTPAPVVVYPGEVKVTLVPKKKPELDVQTPMGGIAVLRCFATGNPAPNVTWSRNNVVVNTNQGRYVLTSSGDLTIVQVRQTDSGSYVCVAGNGLGEPVRREVELQVTDPVNLPAYVYGDKNVTQIVTLNRPAVVRCPAGGHPAPMVHWWRNRSRLPLISHRFELARDYSLTFRSVQLSDLGPYTCEAWNRLSTRPASIKVTLLAVGPARATTNEDAQYLQYIVEPPRAPVTNRPSYPYRPTRPPAVPPPFVVVPSVPAVPVNAVIGMDPGNSYVPGSTVAFGCSVKGYPTPNVTWIKDGLPLVPSERLQISVGAPFRVIINNVSTADSGRYGCKAANAVSYSVSEESINIESTIPLNPECIDNGHFANCNLIVRGHYCKNKYYAKFCCRSCALAGQL